MEDESLKVFSERLKETRSKRGLTQKQFIEDLGITPAALSSYETGEKNPSVSVAIRIAKKYQVSLDWLCGLSDSETGVLTVADCLKDDKSMGYFLNNLDALTKETVQLRKQIDEMNSLVKRGILDSDLYEEQKKRLIAQYNYPITDLFNPRE